MKTGKGFYTVMFTLLGATVGLLGIYILWSTGMMTTLSELDK